jgi:hypothetical protein
LASLFTFVDLRATEEEEETTTIPLSFTPRKTKLLHKQRNNTETLLHERRVPQKRRELQFLGGRIWDP